MFGKVSGVASAHHLLVDNKYRVWLVRKRPSRRSVLIRLPLGFRCANARVVDDRLEHGAAAVGG